MRAEVIVIYVCMLIIDLPSFLSSSTRARVWAWAYMAWTDFLGLTLWLPQRPVGGFQPDFGTGQVFSHLGSFLGLWVKPLGYQIKPINSKKVIVSQVGKIGSLWGATFNNFWEKGQVSGSF